MKKPRVQVTLSEDQYQLLQRLAKVNNQSMSSVVGELVEAAEPTLERVAVLCEYAARARNEQREGMKKALEEVQAEMEPLLVRALNVLGVGPEEVAELGRAAARPGKGPQRATDPDPRTCKHGGQVGRVPRRGKGGP